jgi:hypothetical protein
MFSNLQDRLSAAVKNVHLPAALAATAANGDSNADDAVDGSAAGSESPGRTNKAVPSNQSTPGKQAGLLDNQSSPGKPGPALPDNIEACHIRLRKYEEKLHKAAELAQRYKAMSARQQSLEQTLTKHTPLNSLSSPDAVDMLDTFLSNSRAGEDILKDEVRRLAAEVEESKKGADKALQSKLRDKEEVGGTDTLLFEAIN